MNAELLWGLMIKGTVVLAISGALSLFLRRSSGASRHLVWLAALVTVLLLPLAALPLPAWKVEQEKVPIVTTLILPTALKGAPPRTYPEPSPSREIVPRGQVIPAEKMDPVQTPLDLKSMIFEAWELCSLAVLTWFLLGLIRVGWLVRNSYPIQRDDKSLDAIAWGRPSGNPEIDLTIAQCGAKGARALICERLTVPATTGLLRPAILLPKESVTWDAERLRMVIVHECAHIKRRDWLWQTVAQLACAIHFFNPLVWFASSQMRKESELACDDLVLGQGIEPAAYAQELLDIAKAARFEFASSVSMARTKSIEHRLRSMLDSKRNRKRASGYALMGALVASLAVALPIATLQALPKLASKIPGQLDKKPSWVKPLPQIPLVTSPQVEPNVYLAKDGVAGLPNGFRVKLVGIARQEGETWGLDGKTLSDEDYWRVGGRAWQGNVFREGNHGISSGAFGREFVVEIESDRNVDAGVTSFIVNKVPLSDNERRVRIFHGYDDQVPEVPLAKLDPAYARILLSTPNKPKTATYRFAVAGTDWKTIAQVDNPLKELKGLQLARASIQLSDQPELEVEAGGQYQYVQLLKGASIPPNQARRVLLYDASGQIIPLPRYPQFDLMGFLAQDFKPDVFKRIDKIVLQTSPYLWAEFRDVPLRPDFEAERAARLDPHIRGTATGIAPGFSKLLPNGVTVSISSVSKAALDGKAWTFASQPAWRADGQILADPPKVSEWSAPVDPYGKTPLVQFDLQYENLPNGASTFAFATGSIEPKFWLKGDFPISGAIYNSTVTAYQGSAETGGVKVGVATGPWKTVATEAVNIPEQPRLLQESKYNYDRTGISMRLGEIPTFTPGPNAKPIDLTGKPDFDDARRFVAVLKSGRRKTLMPGGRGIRGIEGFDIPARHGEWSEKYNNLITSDIKAIELQMRPYDWVDFENVKLNPVTPGR